MHPVGVYAELSVIDMVFRRDKQVLDVDLIVEKLNSVIRYVLLNKHQNLSFNCNEPIYYNILPLCVAQFL